jgi:hypothetical protein
VGAVVDLRDAVHWATAGAIFECFVIVAKGHGEGEQFFQRLSRLGKLHDNSPGSDRNAIGQVPELLVEHSDGSLAEDLRRFDPFSPEPLEKVGHLLPALDLEPLIVTAGDFAQSPDNSITVGEIAGSNFIGDAGARICWARRRPT